MRDRPPGTLLCNAMEKKLVKFRIFPPQTMETIYEQKLESPVMITSAQQKFMMHGKHLANTGKPMTPISPLSPAASASSQSPTSPSLAKKPSQSMREWVKRSGSGSGSGSGIGPGRSAKHVATLSVPRHQKLPIVHLGGGRLGESDIEPSFPTGLRTMTRNPSIQREGSADSRVTQWIDLYPEAIERMNGNVSGTRQTQQLHPKHTRTMSESSTIKQTRWKFHPDHHAAAPPEIDPRPCPLRVPSAKKKTPAEDDGLKGSSPTNTTLARSDSKWKPLPILPAQQQATQSAQALTKPNNSNGIPARKPLQAPQATEAIQLPKRGNSPERTATRPKTPTRHTTDPGQAKKTTSAFPPPLTIYVTPPPTPDSEGSGPTTQETVPKLVSGPPALRINTGNPSPPSTITIATDTLSQSDKTAVAVELPAETTLRASVASPTTQSDSLLSTDMDDAFKITIGMMCLNDLDLGLGVGGKDESETQARPRNQVEMIKTAPSPGDLDSPLASIPRLFSPLSPTTFPLSPQQQPLPLVSAPRTISSSESTTRTVSPTQKGQRKPSHGRQETRSPKSPGTSPRSPSPSTSVSASLNLSSAVPTSTFISTSIPFTSTVQSQAKSAKTTTTNTTAMTITNTNANVNGKEKEKTTSRYTKEERMWLHQHYRGEAPFLRAWGLDIKSVADREEGTSILRDLMGMESMSD